MSALAKFRAVAGLDAASRVKKFQSALAASDTRRARLDEALEAAAATFQETADVAALKAAEDAVAAEETARKALVHGLETARRDLAGEEAAEAARALEAKHARLRAEAARFGETITEKLVELGKLLGSHESIMDNLPSGERFRQWPAAYAETATKQLLKVLKQPSETGIAGIAARAQMTREIVLTLSVPIEKVD